MCGSIDKWTVIKIFISLTNFFHTFLSWLFTELGHSISDAGSWHMITEALFQSHGICGEKKVLHP
jgi:hypothetical protein